MKGALAAITITLGILAGSMSLMGELSARGLHFEKDMTEARQEAQVRLIKLASLIGLSEFPQYRLGQDKYENQTSALNIFALMVGLPVLILAPVVFLQGLTKWNRLLAMMAFGIALSGLVISFSPLIAGAIFMVQWFICMVYAQKIRGSEGAQV